MKLLYIVSIVALLLPGGCPNRVAEGPPTIKYGQDECALCGMILNEERFAAALIVETDAARSYLLFDDIGDQLKYESEHHPLVISRFVHDFNSRQWIVAENAAYVVSETLHTPMGSGIVAFRDIADARSKAAEANGQIYQWKDLVLSSPAKTAPCCSGQEK